MPMYSQLGLISGGSSLSGSSSGLAPLHKPGVEDDVPDVVSVEDPGKEPLQAQSIPSVGTRSILSLWQHIAIEIEIAHENKLSQILLSVSIFNYTHLVGVPVVRRWVNPCSFESVSQLLFFPRPHGPTHHFPNTCRCHE